MQLLLKIPITVQRKFKLLLIIVLSENIKIYVKPSEIMKLIKVLQIARCMPADFRFRLLA